MAINPLLLIRTWLVSYEAYQSVRRQIFSNRVQFDSRTICELWFDSRSKHNGPVILSSVQFDCWVQLSDFFEQPWNSHLRPTFVFSNHFFLFSCELCNFFIAVITLQLSPNLRPQCAFGFKGSPCALSSSCVFITMGLKSYLIS